MPDTQTPCPATDPRQNDPCTWPEGHGDIRARSKVWDHGNSVTGVFWRDLPVPVLSARITNEQAGDLATSIREEFVNEPGAVEIRIAALAAASRVWSTHAGHAEADTVIRMARKFETFILEAPA